jgi:hypothetical protein
LSKSGEAVRLLASGANLTAASDPNDTPGLVDRVDVGAEPTAGIPTFIYDTNNGTFDLLSVSGVNGAFTAATSTDVGSPGTVLNVPSFNSITQTNGGIALSWSTQPNWTNTVQFKKKSDRSKLDDTDQSDWQQRQLIEVH